MCAYACVTLCDVTSLGVVTQFMRAAKEMGFGAMAHDIFAELDVEGCGKIRYADLLTTIKGRTLSKDAKRVMTGLASSYQRQFVTLDTSDWRLDVESEEGVLGVRQQLAALTQNAGGRVSDLYRVMMGEAATATALTLTRDRFGAAMARVGMPPKHAWLISQIWRELDDGSGRVGEQDFAAWLMGSEGRKTRARKLRLDGYHDGIAKSGTSNGKLAEEWSPEMLRAKLQQALIDANLAPLDLLRAYDSNRDGTFSRREFLSAFKTLFSNELTWRGGARDAVRHMFRAIAGEDSYIDVAELQRWLQSGWLDAARAAGTAQATSASQQGVSPEHGAWQPPPAWPARAGSTPYARRWAYRAAPPSAVPGRKPFATSSSRGVWRPTSASLAGRHLLAQDWDEHHRLDSANLRHVRSAPKLAPRRVVCYYQEHRPAPQRPVTRVCEDTRRAQDGATWRWDGPPLAAGTSLTRIIATYRMRQTACASDLAHFGHDFGQHDLES